MTTFYTLGLSKPVLKAVQNMGFEEATPIQEQTIPIAMTGRDVMGQAQTGTGKTAAFGIPMIEKINQDLKKLQGLIIAPTRELAIQVAGELNKLGRYKGVRAISIYGGEHMGKQIRSLRDNPQIVVATPGRLLDHIRRKTIDLSMIHTTVLDEADEMLNMGFIEDIRSILRAVPDARQTLLFSATMPAEIQEIGKKLMKKPETVKIKAKEMTVKNIDQYFVEVHERQKFDALTRFLDIHTPELALIFGRTKKRVDELKDALHTRGFRAEGIHGDLTQGKRLSVLNKFKHGRVDILVATDVAARGLDITGITHVYNFDIPQDPESYVHRIGRTGRAGNKGTAVSFVTSRETAQLHLIEKITKSKMQRLSIPTSNDASKGQQQASIDKLAEIINNKDLTNYRESAAELLAQHDSTDVVAAALSILTNERKDTPVHITAIEPISVRQAQKSMDKKKGYNRKGNNNNRNRYSRNNNNERNSNGGNGKKNYHSKKPSSYRGNNQRSQNHKSS